MRGGCPDADKPKRTGRQFTPTRVEHAEQARDPQFAGVLVYANLGEL
jgi:hypothetical protein